MVHIVDLKTQKDERGNLTSIEALSCIPIEIKRIFYMHHINEDRGGHAHIDTDQVIIPISGNFKVKTFDGNEENIFILNDCTKGLYTPRLTFCDLYDFSEDAVCLVLANTNYNMNMSLRTKEDFINYIKRNQE